MDPRYTYNKKHLEINFEHIPIYIGKGKDNRKDFHLYESRLSSTKGNRLKNNKLKKIIKSGLDPIISIIYDDLTEVDAMSNEINLIESIGRLDIKTGTLTNLTSGGEGQSGSKQFIKENNPFFGKKHNPKSFINMSKPIIQKDLKGNIIKTYYSIEEASRQTNSLACKISACAKGKRKTHNKFKWEYVNNISKNKLSKKCKKTPFIKIIQLDENKNIIKEWDTIKEVIDNNSGYKKYDLINCLKNRTTSYKNFYWEYKMKTLFIK
jgi:hypothetical protein